MFKFDFNIEDPDDELNGISVGLASEREEGRVAEQKIFSEIAISQLLNRLPSLISHSPISVPISSGGSLTLNRRDLFDARFQLISETGAEDRIESDSPEGIQSALGFVEAPSDLVPGVYEGGLKTWECSVDLVDYLQGLPSLSDIRGTRVLEIGCGTAVPSLYLLHQLFSASPTTDGKGTSIHLQDYNNSVLELVSLPNVLITWYMSPSAAAYRETKDQNSDLTILDPSSPSELSITPKLKSAFLASLKELKISIRFFSGSWDSFDISSTGGRYDLVLTSETIYRKDSLPSLIKLMQSACNGLPPHQPPDAPVSTQLSLSSLPAGSPYLCLVAAKVMYFGVGGGVVDFIDAVKNTKTGCERASIETVWEQNVGVSRRIMRVQWE